MNDTALYYARKTWKYLLVYGMATVFAFFAAFPFIWMIITMFKDRTDLVQPLNNPFWFNKPATWEHVKYLFEQTHYVRFIENSFFIGMMVVVITLLTAFPAAYSLARLAGRWGERLGILIFLVYLIPPTLLFVPMYRVVSFLGLENTRWALIVVYPTFTIPFCTWLLIGFIRSIPKELEEQAMVDGYSRFGAMLRVVVPLSVPGIITVVVFAFMLTLHEFIYALAFTHASSEKPISVGVTTELIRGDYFHWSSLMAAAVIVALPVAVVYNLFLNRLLRG